MHEHIPHLIQTVLTRHSAGLALTLAAMRARLICGELDQPAVGELTERCQRLFHSLAAEASGRIDLALGQGMDMRIELSADPAGNRYAIRFLPPAAFAERWGALYPRQMTIERWPGGLN